MTRKTPALTAQKRDWRPLLLTAALLLVLIAFVFRASFTPSLVLFANDGPLGVLKSESLKMPDAYSGMWMDLNWVGAPGGNGAIGFTYLLLWILGPVGFAKFYVPLALIISGLCAWTFFRTLRFGPAVCLLGGLAAALNSNFFSNACWGLATRSLCLGAVFLALAAVQSSGSGKTGFGIIKIILAGFAIGLAIAEGGDNGAIFSLFVAAYAFFQVVTSDGPVFGRVFKGGSKVALMAICAAILAAQTLNIFVGTAVKPVAQDTQAPEQKWAFATQWSLPKLESWRVVIPGLFGYRLDTEGGGNYWGGVGQDLAWEEGHKDPEWAKAHPFSARHSGAGEYAGILVVLVACWALAHSLVRSGGVFSQSERRTIWFWGGAALVALVLSWGRHAPFYWFVYQLPYFSTIRNPMKFMHPFHMILMILFAYGLEGIWRRYLLPVGAMEKGKPAFSGTFEKRWSIGLAIVGVMTVLGWLIFVSSRSSLERHIASVGFDLGMAAEIARFSTREAGWSLLFLVAAGLAVVLIMKGVFGGARAKWAWAILGLILVTDLARANVPWIRYYDYKEKYANNGVFDVLAERRYEHRIVMPALQGDATYSMFQQVYAVEWLQHQFPFYNIQSLDQPQDPRLSAEKLAYRSAFSGKKFIRLWELTNTRFLGGLAKNFAEALNQQFDDGRNRFKVSTPFTLSQDPVTQVISAQVNANGPFALVEFTGALPRAKLYSKWEVSTNDEATLKKLADPAFDPHEQVLVADAITPAAASATNATAGTVEFASYSPKRVELRANAALPSVLLLNDKVDPGWKVWVDGRPGTILRCNFLMRGVQLSPGNHTILFRFQPDSTIFYVSLAATLVGLVLCGIVALQRRGEGKAGASSASAVAVGAKAA